MVWLCIRLNCLPFEDVLVKRYQEGSRKWFDDVFIIYQHGSFQFKFRCFINLLGSSEIMLSYFSLSDPSGLPCFLKYCTTKHIIKIHEPSRCDLLNYQLIIPNKKVRHRISLILPLYGVIYAWIFFAGSKYKMLQRKGLKDNHSRVEELQTHNDGVF